MRKLSTPHTILNSQTNSLLSSQAKHHANLECIFTTANFLIGIHNHTTTLWPGDGSPSILNYRHVKMVAARDSLLDNRRGV